MKQQPTGGLTFPIKLRCGSAADLMSESELEAALTRALGRAFMRARSALPAVVALGAGVVLRPPYLIGGALSDADAATVLVRVRRAIEAAARGAEVTDLDIAANEAPGTQPSNPSEPFDRERYDRATDTYEMPSYRGGKVRASTIAPDAAGAKDPTSEEVSPVRSEIDEVDYAFVFAGGPYGRAAESFIRVYYPSHHLILAQSFEEMFDRLWSDIRLGKSHTSATRPHRRHLRELIIVTHATAEGGLNIPLTRGNYAHHGWITYEDIADLQEQFQEGLYSDFQEKRRDVVSSIVDAETRVIVRGCQFGQSDDAMRVLRIFFGGQPEVWAALVYQGYEENLAEQSSLHTPEEAFNFLVLQDFLPPVMRPAPDEDKRTYIARVFGLHGPIPGEFFLVGKEAHDRFKKLSGRRLGASKQAESLKERSQTETLSTGLGSYWAVSRELDSVPLREIFARAHELRNPYRPQNARLLLRLKAAWERRQLSDPIFRNFLGSPEATSVPIFDTGAFLEYLSRRFRDRPEDNPFNGLPIENLFFYNPEWTWDARDYPGRTDDAFETDWLPKFNKGQITEFTTEGVSIPYRSKAERKTAITFEGSPAVANPVQPPRAPGVTSRQEDLDFLEARRFAMDPSFWKAASKGGVCIEGAIWIHDVPHRGTAVRNSDSDLTKSVPDKWQREAVEAFVHTSTLIVEEKDPVEYWNAHADSVMRTVATAQARTGSGWDVYEFYADVSEQIIELGVGSRFEQGERHYHERGELPAGEELYATEFNTLVRALESVRRTGSLSLKKTARIAGRGVLIADGPLPAQNSAAAAELKDFVDRRKRLESQLKRIETVLSLIEGGENLPHQIAKLRTNLEFRNLLRVTDVINTLAKLARDGVSLAVDIGAGLEALAPAGLRRTFWKGLQDKNHWLQIGVEFVGKATAILEAALNIEKVWDAFQEGNARKEAFSLYSFFQSTIEIARVFSSTGRAFATPATGILFLIWAEIDILLTVADILRGFKKLRDKEAVVSFIDDAVSLARSGNEIFTASVVLNEAAGEVDPVSVAASSRADKVIKDNEKKFASGADRLLWHMSSGDGLPVVQRQIFGTQAQATLQRWRLFGLLQDQFFIEEEVRKVYARVRAVATDARERYKPDAK